MINLFRVLVFIIPTFLSCVIPLLILLFPNAGFAQSIKLTPEEQVALNDGNFEYQYVTNFDENGNAKSAYERLYIPPTIIVQDGKAIELDKGYFKERLTSFTYESHVAGSIGYVTPNAPSRSYQPGFLPRNQAGGIDWSNVAQNKFTDFINRGGAGGFPNIPLPKAVLQHEAKCATIRSNVNSITNQGEPFRKKVDSSILALPGIDAKNRPRESIVARERAIGALIDFIVVINADKEQVDALFANQCPTHIPKWQMPQNLQQLKEDCEFSINKYYSEIENYSKQLREEFSRKIADIENTRSRANTKLASLAKAVENGAVDSARIRVESAKHSLNDFENALNAIFSHEFVGGLNKDEIEAFNRQKDRVAQLKTEINEKDYVGEAAKAAQKKAERVAAEKARIAEEARKAEEIKRQLAEEAAARKKVQERESLQGLKPEIQLGHKSPYQVAGDPVDIATGTFLLNETDLVLNWPIKFELKRNYSSARNQVGDFGYSWKHNFCSFLTITNDEKGEIIEAFEEDGTMITYRLIPGGKDYQPNTEDNPALSGNRELRINKLNSRIYKSSYSRGSSYYLCSSEGDQRIYEVLSEQVEQKKPRFSSWSKDGEYLNFIYGEEKNGIKQNDYEKLNKIDNRAGGWIKFSYNDKGFIKKAYTSDGKGVQYEYDQFDDLVQVIYSDGSFVKYEYEKKTQPLSRELYSTHRITKVIHPGERVLENTYDEKGRVVAQKSGVGKNLIQNTSFEFKKESADTDSLSIVIVKDAKGNSTENYFYKGKIYKIIDPLGQTILRSWYINKDNYFDAVSEQIKSSPKSGYPYALKEEVNKRGLITRYKYNIYSGNVVEKEVVGKGLTSSSQEEESIKTYYEYNISNNKLINSYYFDKNGKKKGRRHTYEKWATNRVNVSEEYCDSVILLTREKEYTTFLKKEIIKGLPDEPAYVVEYTRDDKGRIISKSERTLDSNAPAIVTNYKYNAAGQIEEEVDTAGNVVRYSYDSMGRCLSIFHYDSRGELLKKSTMTYSPNGEVTSVQGSMSDPEDVIDYEYNHAGDLVKASSQLRYNNSADINTQNTPVTSLFRYDLLNNLVGTVDPNSNSLSMEYDALGQLKRAYDEEEEVSYEYEPGGKIASMKDILGNVTNYEYTLLGWLKKITYPNGSSVTYKYDIEGRVIEEIYDNDSGDQEKIQITYDDAIRQEIRTSSEGTEKRRYDSRGNLIEYIDVEGNTYKYSYDGLGRLLSKTNPNFDTTIYSYDPKLNTVTIRDAQYNKTVLTFDGIDRLIKLEVFDSLENKLVETRRLTYEPSSNAVTECIGDDGNCKRVVRNQFSKPIREEIFDLEKNEYVPTKVIHYDNNGNPIKIKDAKGNTTHLRYDSENRVIEKTLPDGSAITYNRQNKGNELTINFPNGMKWNGRHNTVSGKLITDSLIVNDKESRKFEYFYDKDRLTKLVDPRGIEFEYKYDESDNLTEIITSTGEKRSYTYNKGGQCTSIIQEGLESTTKIQHEFDTLGNILKETIYLNGKVHQETEQEFDAVGNRRSFEVLNQGPGGRRLFEYTATNKLAGCEIVGTAVNLSYEYSTAGVLTKRSCGTYVQEIEHKSSNELPSSIVHSSNGSELFKQSAQWNAKGLLEKYTHETKSSLEKTNTYGYDNRDRYNYGTSRTNGGESKTCVYDFNEIDILLETFCAGDDEEEFVRVVLDVYGNQIIEEKFQETLALLERVTSLEACESKDANVETIKKKRKYAYDGIGNVVSIEEPQDGSEKKLTWNAWGQLVRVEKPGLVWTATYDGLGRRLMVTSEKEKKKSEIKSYYDPEVEFLEIGVEVNECPIWKIYGPDLNGEYGGLNGVGGLEALVLGSGSLMLINDLFGHIIGYKNGEEIVWKNRDIDPYGNVDWFYLEEIEGRNNNLLKAVAESTYWRSKRCDITGLVYIGARYYHPASGRFISPDPMGHSGSLDLYNYAGGDPVNFFDPDGRFMMAAYERTADFVIDFGEEMVDIGNEALAIAQLGWGINSQMNKHNINLAIENKAGIASFGADFTPGVSNAKSIQEALSGTNLITGERLGIFDRGVAGAGIVVGPIAKGIGKGLKWGSWSVSNFGGFVKSALKRLRDEGYQVHHLISDTNPATKNHMLLKLADFDLQGASNLMFLPKKGGIHPTRSIHRGAHRKKYSQDLADAMKDIVEQGQMNNWNQEQYHKKLMELLQKTRHKLKKGSLPLNSVTE